LCTPDRTEAKLKLRPTQAAESDVLVSSDEHGHGGLGMVETAATTTMQMSEDLPAFTLRLQHLGCVSLFTY
jgi:hypothetical protein